MISPAEVHSFLREAGWTPPPPEQWTALTGGISSQLWRVDLAEGPICVKAARDRLLVADDWQAPLSRNEVEQRWLTWAATVAPDHVPAVLAHDPARGVFAMTHLADHRVWKSDLLAGRVEPTVAAAVGAVLGRWHAASAADPRVRARFQQRDNFHALRIRPYLVVTAERVPEVRTRLLALADRAATSDVAVVHGDVSPKNILLGPLGPVLLDAECACVGDPAFDLAFCLTHLVLKAVRRPSDASVLLAAADGLLAGYRPTINWEPRSDLASRVAALLPALVLARVEGSSPVDYLDAAQRSAVRRAAVATLLTSDGELRTVLARLAHPGTLAVPSPGQG